MKKYFSGLVLAAFCSLAVAAGYEVQVSTANQPLIFFLTATADLGSGAHISGLTGLGSGATVTLSKNGGSFAAPSGAVSEIANGWYKVAANSTDSSTQGPLILHATGSGADPTDEVFSVVAYNPQDAVRLGLTALPNVASGSAGAIITSGSGTAQLTVTGGLASSNTTQLAGQTVTAGAGVTFPGSVASPTNITAGTITTVTGNVNGSVGSLGATAKTDVTTAANAATPTCSALGSTAISNVTTAATAATPACASVSGTVNADIKKVNGVTILGNGTSTPFGP